LTRSATGIDGKCESTLEADNKAVIVCGDAEA